MGDVVKLIHLNSLNEAAQLVQVFLPQIMARELDPKVSYWVARVFKALSSKLREKEKERIALCEKYATRDASGKVSTENATYQFSEENQALFEKELQELYSVPATIMIQKIKITEHNCKGLRPVDIVNLDTIFETEADRLEMPQESQAVD